MTSVYKILVTTLDLRQKPLNNYCTFQIIKNVCMHSCCSSWKAIMNRITKVSARKDVVARMLSSTSARIRCCKHCNLTALSPHVHHVQSHDASEKLKTWSSVRLEPWSTNWHSLNICTYCMLNLSQCTCTYSTLPHSWSLCVPQTQPKLLWGYLIAEFCSPRSLLLNIVFWTICENNFVPVISPSALSAGQQRLLPLP